MSTTVSSPSLTVGQLKAIDFAKEDLVRAAERLLNEASVTQIPKRLFGDSQLRNLIAVAGETESPAVVANFIRYQMGRDSRGTHWRRAHGGPSLGDRFIQEIEGEGGTIWRALENEELSHLEGPPRQLAKMALIRHFFGFASRYLKYLEPQRSQ